MRILVVRLSSIGDVVHTIPSVAALAAALPGARIDWVVESPAAPIVAALPFVAEVRVPVRVRPADGPYDLALDFQGLFRSSILTVLSGARRRVGRGRWPWLDVSVPMFDLERTPHAVENSARVLAAAGVSAGDVDGAAHLLLAGWGPRLAARGAQLASDLRLPSSFRAFVPDARWPSKRLPALPEGTGPPWVVLGGQPGSGLPRAARDLRGRLPLLDSVALALVADHVVAADTGPAHLAAFLGARITGCFGPTRPESTGLRGPRATNLSASCGGCLRRRCSRARSCLTEVLASALDR